MIFIAALATVKRSQKLEDVYCSLHWLLALTLNPAGETKSRLLSLSKLQDRI